jgi:hypothetical protein
MIAVASLTCGLVHVVGPEISQHHVSHDELAQGWLARARWAATVLPAVFMLRSGSSAARDPFAVQPTSLNKPAKGSLSND